MTDTTIPPDLIAAAQASDTKWHVPASVTLAQAILETGWFKDFPGGSGSNNYFGMKAEAGEPSVTSETHEDEDGHHVTIDAAFRTFDNAADCFDAHGELIAQDPRYSPCFGAADAFGFAAELQACGYATDQTYASKLISLMRGHNLTQYDAA